MVKNSDVMTDRCCILPKISSASSKRKDESQGTPRLVEPRTRIFARKYQLAASAGRLRYVHSHRPTLAMSRGKLQIAKRTETAAAKPVSLTVKNRGKSDDETSEETHSSELELTSEDENTTAPKTEEFETGSGNSQENESVVSTVHPLVNAASRVSLTAANLQNENVWLGLAPMDTTAMSVTENSNLNRTNFGLVLPYLNEFQPPRKKSASRERPHRTEEIFDSDCQWTMSTATGIDDENYRDGVRRAHENVYLLRNVNRKKSAKWSDSNSGSFSSSSSNRSKQLYPPTGSLTYDNHSINCPLCELYTPSKKGHICPPNSPDLSRPTSTSGTTSSLDISLSDFSSPTSHLEFIVSD